MINNRTNNSLKYFTALINSKLFEFIYVNKLVTNKDSTPQLKKVDLDKFPVYVCDLNNNIEKSIHNEIINQVDLLLKLNGKLREINILHKIDHIKTRIEHIEERLNHLIFQLYGLSKVEIESILKYDYE